MAVEYSWRNELREAALSSEASWSLFDKIAAAIVKKFHGRFVEKLDGIDERYWDIEIQNMVLILHLQHYVGIVLFPAKRDGNSLVEEVGKYLEDSVQES